MTLYNDMLEITAFDMTSEQWEVARLFLPLYYKASDVHFMRVRSLGRDVYHFRINYMLSKELFIRTCEVIQVLHSLGHLKELNRSGWCELNDEPIE